MGPFVMSLITRLLGHLLPDDPKPGCGYLRFKLPLDHPFTPACNLHDYEFGLNDSNQAEHTLDETDVMLFNRWALIAKNQPTVNEQINLMLDICRYWPIGHRVGKYLW